MDIRPLLCALCLATLACAAPAQTVRRINLPCNDLFYDPHTRLLYASLPSSAGSRGNSIVPIDPVTGALGAHVFMGSEPDRIAASDDGRYLYVGLDGAAAVRRFNLKTQTAGPTFSLGSDPVYGPYTVGAMAVPPGSPHSVAVLQYASYNAALIAVIYDDGVPRPGIFTIPYPESADEIGFGASP